MANTLLTPTAITREAGRILHQKANFIGACNKQYDDQFKNGGATVKGKFGPSLKYRLPNEYTVRDGMTMSAQDTEETSEELIVSKVKGVDVSFTSEDLALSLDDFSKRILAPAMSVLAANIEADALSMRNEVYNLVNGGGSAFSFDASQDARQKLTEALAPTDNRCVTLEPTHATDFIKDTKGLFQSSSNVKEQYREGKLGRTAGFDWMENTLLNPHVSGTAAETTGYLVDGASQTGAALTVDTGSNTFLVGDVITIAGVNRVHPETKVDTGQLQQFVITANSGNSATSLSIAPAIVTSGGRQNVTGSPADNAAVSKIGGSSVSSRESLAFHKDAFAFVTADLPMPDGVDFKKREVVDGISIAMVRDFNINDRSFPCRLDVLYGYKAIRPQLATRLRYNG